MGFEPGTLIEAPLLSDFELWFFQFGFIFVSCSQWKWALIDWELILHGGKDENPSYKIYVNRFQFHIFEEPVGANNTYIN